MRQHWFYGLSDVTLGNLQHIPYIHIIVQSDGTCQGICWIFLGLSVVDRGKQYKPDFLERGAIKNSESTECYHRLVSVLWERTIRPTTE